MSATNPGNIQNLSVQIYPAVDDTVEKTFPVQGVRVTPELEQFMKKICEMVESHPEWLDQRPAERVRDILSAIHEL